MANQRGKIRGKEPAIWSNWKGEFFWDSSALLSLEELLIAFATVDGVPVNEDLIQEITHWFTANPTLKAILMAANAKVFKGDLRTILNLTAAVSADPFSYSLRW